MANNIKDNTPGNLYLRLVQAAIVLAMVSVCSALIYAHFTIRDIERGWDQLGALTTEKEQIHSKLFDLHQEHHEIISQKELAKTASLIKHTKKLNQKQAELTAQKEDKIDQLNRNIAVLTFILLPLLGGALILGFRAFKIQRRTAEKLKSYRDYSENLLLAINAANIGMTIGDPSLPDLPLIYVNETFKNMTGYEEDEILSYNCRFLQGPDTDPQTVAKIREAIARQIELDTEILNYRRDGTPFWNRLNISPVHDKDGTLRAYIGIQEDITLIKQTQEALRRERDFITHIIDYVPSLIVGMHPDGEVNFINQYALDVLKCGRDHIIGKNWWAMVFEGQEDKIEEKKARHLRNEPLEGFEMTLEDFEGGKHLISFTFIKQYDESGQLVQIIGAAHDMTAERVRALKERERHKLESLGTMAGGIAHEINNALMPIILLSEHFRDTYQGLDKQTDENLSTIIEYGLHAKNIVSDILKYARSSQQQSGYMDARALVEGSVKFVRDLLPATVQISSDISDDIEEDHQLFVNETGFLQVMSNLMLNAAYASDNKGKIQINTFVERAPAENSPESGKEILHLEVIDNGCGIDENDIGNIFDPFFTTKAEGQGTGLGLSVIYGLIKEWNGEIRVLSQKNEGTRFIIKLPLFKRADTV